MMTLFSVSISFFIIIGQCRTRLLLLLTGLVGDSDKLGIKANTHLKSLTIKYGFDATLHVPDVIARTLVHMASTQLSVLTVNLCINSHSLGKQTFERSGWDSFLAVLARPLFEWLECIKIVLSMDYMFDAKGRRLHKMLPEWLAPLKAKGVLQVLIESDTDEGKDGPFVEGDQSILQDEVSPF